jgi:hypothetical protein
MFAIISAKRIPRPGPEECVVELTDSMWTLMASCWEYSADKRPSIVHVLASLTSHMTVMGDILPHAISDQPEEPLAGAESKTASNLVEAEPAPAQNQWRLHSCLKGPRDLQGTRSSLQPTDRVAILAHTNNSTEAMPTAPLPFMHSSKPAPTSGTSTINSYAKSLAPVLGPVSIIPNALKSGATYAPDTLLNVTLDDSNAASLLANQYQFAAPFPKTNTITSISTPLISDSTRGASATSIPRSLKRGVNTGYTPVSFDSAAGVNTNTFYGSYVSSLLHTITYHL